jgi:hypothetical protein
MKQRMTAEQARKIGATAPAKRPVSRSTLWEKNKWDVMRAALSGRTNHLITGSDEYFIEKVGQLGISTSEVRRSKRFEQLRAEFESQYRKMEEGRAVWFEELENLVLQDWKTVNKWPELGYFVNAVEEPLDEYSEEDDEVDDFLRAELAIQEDEERFSYDYGFVLEHFEKNVDSYPSGIAILIRRIISAEEEYYSAKCKSEKFAGFWDWELDEKVDEDERAFYANACPLPDGCDSGFVIDWSERTDNWDYSKFTGRINGEFLSWVSSKPGQVAISEVENVIEKASGRNKSDCALIIKVGQEAEGKRFEYRFPSFETFRVIFELLGYAVNLNSELKKRLSEFDTVKVSISWGV